MTDIIQTTLEENLAMIEDTIRYVKEQGRDVIFDAEHFFDGYKNNAEYAMASLEAAYKGGARVLALCDTNGGTMPFEIRAIVGRSVRGIRMRRLASIATMTVGWRWPTR